MHTTIYDLKFNDTEKRQIHRLRALDANRIIYAACTGIATFVAVFASQIPFHGLNWLHVLASYGCIPAGIAAGIYVNRRIDKYVENQFKHNWDPLFYQRAGTTPAKEAAREEMLRLTDDPKFYSLPEKEQKMAMERINRKYGI